MNPLNKWMASIRLLLAPALIHCLICGKHGRSSAGMPGICTSCEAGIPWIGQPRCPKCGRHVGCPDCSRSGQSDPIICNRSAVAYTPVMRELLGRYKYRGHERLAPLLGLMLDSAYIQLESFNGDHQRNRQISRAAPWQADLLVPVPVSESRLMERGFNQAERLADVLSRCRRIPQLPLLVRTHHTGKQSFKSRAERIADMKHAFGANMNESVGIQFAGMLDKAEQEDRPMQIIIIDDIYTTGSTIRACAEVLRHMCESYGKTSEIYSLTWARS